LVGLPIDRLVCRSIDWSAGRSIGLPIDRLVCRSIGLSLHTQQIADSHVTGQALNRFQYIETLKYL
jgi:hypothetical protein